MIKAKKNKIYTKRFIYELFAYLLKFVTYPNTSDVKELYDIPHISKGIIFDGVFVVKRKIFKYVYVYVNNDI